MMLSSSTNGLYSIPTNTKVVPFPTEPDFIPCSCSGEGISVSQDSEAPYDLFVNFWSNGFQGKRLSFWLRLRWCWDVLRTGTPWQDFMLLPQTQIPKLVNALLKRRLS